MPTKLGDTELPDPSYFGTSTFNSARIFTLTTFTHRIPSAFLHCKDTLYLNVFRLVSLL